MDPSVQIVVPTDILLCGVRNLLNLSGQAFIRAVTVAEDTVAMMKMNITRYREASAEPPWQPQYHSLMPVQPPCDR